MAPDSRGICPNCESRLGSTGDPCSRDLCSRKGYHHVAIEWYDAARAFAVRKHKALDPLLGRCIDRYLVTGKLGEGGMGAVYLALQRPLNREVALKVISGLELTPVVIARFEREARAIALLDHANVRKLYDYGIGDLEYQVPYMALEYLRHGRTLGHALVEVKKQNGGQIPGAVVLAMFRQVLNALAAAHAKGIVHRDMKPDNVMVSPEHGNPYMVKILDFGLAKAFSDISGFDSDVSRAGHVLGTPHYMAPEQVPRKGRSEADGRADLYAVAVMIFEVFTGTMPFPGETPLEVMARKVDPEFDPLALPAAMTLTRQLRAFVAKGMAVEPEARYQTADEMLEAFESSLSGRATSAVGLARTAATDASDARAPTPPGGGSEPAAAPAVVSGGDAQGAQADGTPELVPSRPAEPAAARMPIGGWWALGLVGLALLAGVLVLGAMTTGVFGSRGTPPAAATESTLPAVPADVAVVGPGEPDTAQGDLVPCPETGPDGARNVVEVLPAPVAGVAGAGPAARDGQPGGEKKDVRAGRGRKGARSTCPANDPYCDINLDRSSETP